MSPPGVLQYSGFQKGVTIALTLGAVIAAPVVYAWGPKRFELLAVFFLPLFILGHGVPRTLQFCLVRHTYDAEGVKYRTPWTPARSLRWAEVTRIRWSKLWGWLVLRDTHGATFRFSNLIGGLEGFADVALRRLPPEVLQASPRAVEALEMMRDGEAIRLTMRRR